MSVLRQAVNVTANYFQDGEITASYLRERGKSREIFLPRCFAVAYVRAVDPKRFSFPVLARMFHRKDHTTMMYAVRKAHEVWGEQLFRRLAMDRADLDYDRIRPPQAIHIAPSYDAMIARGKHLMRTEIALRFLNGEGWSVAA